MSETNLRGQMATLWLFIRIVEILLRRICLDFLRSSSGGGVVNSTMNYTILCLIPKKSESKYVKDFRPISLVSSVYKILAKVLANRLREVLSETISTSQGAFIKE